MIDRDPGPWDRSAQQSWAFSPDEVILSHITTTEGRKYV